MMVGESIENQTKGMTNHPSFVVAANQGTNGEWSTL